MPGTRCFCACSVHDAAAGAQLMVQVHRSLSDLRLHSNSSDDVNEVGDFNPWARCAADCVPTCMQQSDMLATLLQAV